MYLFRRQGHQSVITKENCRYTAKLEKRGIRRTAPFKRSKLLGSIVRDGTLKLSKAAVRKSTDKMRQTFSRVVRTSES